MEAATEGIEVEETSVAEVASMPEISPGARVNGHVNFIYREHAELAHHADLCMRVPSRVSPTRRAGDIKEDEGEAKEEGAGKIVVSQIGEAGEEEVALEKVSLYKQGPLCKPAELCVILDTPCHMNDFLVQEEEGDTARISRREIMTWHLRLHQI